MTINPSQATRTPGKGLKIGKSLGPIATAILAIAVAGTLFAVNVVNDESGTVGIVAQNRAGIVSHGSGSTTASGAAVSTLYLPTPFDVLASTRGYRTGSGVGWNFQLDIVRNPTGANFDCHRTTGRNTATGSQTAIFSNVSATGSINVSTTALTFGPTQGITCNTIGRINSQTLLRLRGQFSDSDVLN